MQYFEWDEKKNEWLKANRGISFEEVVTAINEGRVIKKIIHPNQQRYAGQNMYIIEIDEYAFIVPCIEDEEKIFLKTIYPSRKFTRDYIEKGGV